MKKNYKKVNLTSSDLSQEKLQELRRILPETFSENKIDWDKLRAVLGDKIDSRIEKFSFSWAGKSNAIKNVLIPGKTTLSPAKKESIKFDESKNLFIEGDNLEVLKLLQKAYFEQVKMIYIDPPYNTGGDFVYHDDFTSPLKNYLEQTGQIDSNGNKLQANRETSGRYHSDWLSMMYPRLKLAWNLLRDDGVIFVSIDDNEAHHLRMIMNEVFGEENFVAQIIVQSNKRGQTYQQIAKTHEYLLCYSKSEQTIIQELEKEESDFVYSDDLSEYSIRELRNRNPKFGRFNRPNLFFPIYVNPKKCDKNGFCSIAIEKSKGFVEVLPLNSSGNESCWRWSKSLIGKRNVDDLGQTPVVAKQKKGGGWNIYEKYRKSTFKAKTIWTETDVISEQGTIDLRELGLKEIFEHPKPVGLIKRALQIATDKDGDDLILDFFAGSATTAQAILQQNQEDEGNRKFILVQLPEMADAASNAYKAGYKNIADISKERIRRVVKGYGHNPKPIDDGFKVFKLSESNYPENNFEFDPEKSEEENQKTFKNYLAKAKQTNLFEDGIKEIDVVYENIVKEGFSLNSKISEEKIGKNKVYTVADGERRLLVCLDKKIDGKTVDELTNKNYKDKVFICLDNALDDTVKANLGLNVELKTI